MNDTTHTLGPWFVEEDGWVSSEEYGPICMIQQGGFIDCGMFSSDRANAHLIAAAPELLDALENIINTISWHDDEGLVEHSDQFTAARSAIAKAKGQTQ